MENLVRYKAYILQSIRIINLNESLSLRIRSRRFVISIFYIDRQSLWANLTCADFMQIKKKTEMKFETSCWP